MSVLHGFDVVGAIAVLAGSTWRAFTEYRTRARIIGAQLRKEVLAQYPIWARRRRHQATQQLQATKVWTAEDQREYQRTMHSMRAWTLFIIGTLYTVIVTIFS